MFLLIYLKINLKDLIWNQRNNYFFDKYFSYNCFINVVKKDIY